MYFNFFGLQNSPFHTTPDPEFLYLSPGHKQALGSIIYGIKEKKGFIAVTGQVGLGKTSILRSFLAQIDQANQQTIYVLNPNLSFTFLLKTLVRELEHDPIEGDDAEILEQLHMILIEEYRKGRTVALLIDEAQNMPVATLEHLRILSNLETPKDKLIQIVLLGQPELDGLLDRYELRQLRQRIAVRATIRPLSQQESFQYIRHRLDKAGGEGEKIFTNPALALIVREAKGIPRRLNILCDNALVTAFGYQQSQVTTNIAKEAICDLNGGPSHSPWKLAPLFAGTLILVLTLLALVSLTHAPFWDIPLKHEFGQLFKDEDNPNQNLISNVEEKIPPPPQDGFSLAEKTQTFLTESVPKILEELRQLVASNSDSDRTPSSFRTANVFTNPGDLILTKKPLGDLEDSASVFSEKSEVPTMPEIIKPLIPSPQQKLPDLLIQGEGIATSKLDSPSTEEAPFVETETQSEDASEFNIVQLNAKNFNNDRLVQSTEPPELRSTPNQNIPPSVSVPPTDVTSQEITNAKPDVGALASPVTKILKEGDTLAKLLLDVYGSASPATLRFVLDHNRHIVNVRKIYPGQQIIFPPLEKVEREKIITEADEPLASDKDKELNSSEKIFARSSVQTKPKGKEVEAKRDPPYAVATVQEGDTLEKLVNAVYGSPHPLYIQRVLDYNPKIGTPKKIFPGQDIAFPKIAEEVKVLKNQASQANPLE